MRPKDTSCKCRVRSTCFPITLACVVESLGGGGLGGEGGGGDGDGGGGDDGGRNNVLKSTTTPGIHDDAV